MSGKVIIDGVDVSECLTFTQEQPHLGVNCLNVLLKGGKCELNPNCYYKQLQCLKAENEKLNKEVSDLQFYIDSYKITWEIDKKEQYKQALEEVRELTKLTVEFHNFACKKNCENYKEPKEYHLLCRLMRISEKINEVLKDK